MGNSIVSGLSSKQTEQQAERKGNEAFEKAKAAGMTDTQAEQAATAAMLSMVSPEKRRQLQVNDDGKRLKINFMGENGKIDRAQGGADISLEPGDFGSRHKALVGWISDHSLWGDHNAFNAAMNLLDRRAAYYSYDSIAKRGQQAFESGVVRGEAMYAAGVRNREQIGVDFSGFNRNVDAYVRFREGQRAQFNDFYSGLNGVQRFAFNAGANLFGGLLNGGKAIGNLTAFTGIQGRQAFADSWGGLGNSVAGAASYAYNNPAGFAKSAIVDPITGAWDHYAGIYQADGFGAAAGTLTGNLLSGVPFVLAGSAPIKYSTKFTPEISKYSFVETVPGTAIQTYWPPNSGFMGAPLHQNLEPGYRVSRYGGFYNDAGQFNDFGNFVAPDGVPYTMRALPRGTDSAKPLSVYEVVKQINNVPSGPAAPWFGELGMGVQHELPLTIQDYLDQGYIKLIKRVNP